MDNSKTFCVVPWLQISTKPNGMYRGCCLMFNSANAQGLLRGADGTNLRAGRAAMDEVRNHEVMRRLRREMLAGERSPECSACWQKEDHGLASKRLISNREFSHRLNAEQARALTEADGTTEIRPIYFDLRFGNLCNLKCVMCHPGSSSKWYEDYPAVSGEQHFYDGGEKIELATARDFYNWHEDENFWRDLEARVEEIEQIYFVGGEPLLIERHYDFLELCIRSGRAGHITLEYDTNMTYLKEQALELWPHFKKVLLRVSLDAYGAENDYIRFPSQWDRIAANLERLRSLKLPNIELSYSTTWQIPTVFTVQRLWEHLGQVTSTRVLFTPEFLDIKFLPRDLREDAAQRLKDFATGFVKRDKRAERLIQPYISYLLNPAHGDGNWQQVAEGIRFLEKLDARRKNSWAATFPELYQRLAASAQWGLISGNTSNTLSPRI